MSIVLGGWGSSLLSVTCNRLGYGSEAEGLLSMHGTYHSILRTKKEKEINLQQRKLRSKIENICLRLGCPAKCSHNAPEGECP